MLLSVGVLLASVAPVEAERRWALEACLGVAWNVPTTLLLRQRGHDEARVSARWKTRAFDPPLYYRVRTSRWEGDRAWAVDLTHHKLYLDNPPVEVQGFSISHGYNFVTVHRLERRGDWIQGAGGGLVVAHPESEVRGRSFDEHGGVWGTGYTVAGPAGSGLAARHEELGSGFYLAAELRLTLSYFRVPIAEGSARSANLALHGTFGVGWESGR